MNTWAVALFAVLTHPISERGRVTLRRVYAWLAPHECAMQYGHRADDPPTDVDLERFQDALAVHLYGSPSLSAAWEEPMRDLASQWMRRIDAALDEEGANAAVYERSA